MRRRLAAARGPGGERAPVRPLARGPCRTRAALRVVKQLATSRHGGFTAASRRLSRQAEQDRQPGAGDTAISTAPALSERFQRCIRCDWRWRRRRCLDGSAAASRVRIVSVCRVDAQHKGQLITHSGQLNTATHASVSCPYSWSRWRRRRRLYGPGKAMTGGRRRSYCHLRRQLLGWRPGCKDCCCGWLLLDLLAMSGMLCSVAVSGGTWRTVAADPLCRVAMRQAAQPPSHWGCPSTMPCCHAPGCATAVSLGLPVHYAVSSHCGCPSQQRKHRYGRKGPTPVAFRRAGWCGGSGTGGAPSAPAERRRCWSAAGHAGHSNTPLKHAHMTAAGHVGVFESLCGLRRSECEPTRRRPATSPTVSGSRSYLGSCPGLAATQDSHVFSGWAVTA